MAEKDKKKAELILKVDAAKEAFDAAGKAYKDAIEELRKIAPYTAADYSWGLKG